MRKRLLYMSLFLTLVSGCTTRDPASLFAPSAGVLVIDATMVVWKPFPAVFLSETLPANETSPFGGRSIDGADIVIITGVDTVQYLNTDFGEYGPSFGPRVVLPGRKYRIEVRTSDGRFLTATTTTPARFEVNRWVLLDDAGENVVREFFPFGPLSDDSTMYAQNAVTYSQGLLEAQFAPTAQPGYQVGLFSLDPGSPLIINPDFLDDEDLEDLDRDTASPALDGSEGEIRLPWFAIFFEGRYKIKVYSLDRNWFDFVRSNPGGSGFGFGGNAGDAFPEPIFHVQGGIGLFGSASVDSVGITFLPRP